MFNEEVLEAKIIEFYGLLKVIYLYYSLMDGIFYANVLLEMTIDAYGLPKLPPLSENMADTVAHARTATQTALETTDTTPVKSIPSSSTAPTSSRSSPFPALVPLVRVQRLEVQMATLLHHIHPWMQRSLAEAEERLERKMV